MAYPLQGLRVISLAEQYPGPYCTLLLADLGADVILIERPNGGDPSRQFRTFYAALNRGKRSVALDLKTASGRNTLVRLIANADVLLEGFRPGVMQRLGLGWETLHQANPRLIYASISGFGQTGPYADRPAHDLSYQSVAGLYFREAEAGAPVAPPAPAMADLSSGMFAALGVLTALAARSRDGKGTYIDVAAAEGLVSWMTVQLTPTLNAWPVDQIGTEAGYAVYPCADGALISLSVAHEDWFWRSLCEVMDMGDVAQLPRDERVARVEELRGRLGAAIAKRPRGEWASVLDEARIPWSPVSTLAEVAADPHFRSRGMFARIGDEWHVRQPVKLLGYETGPRRTSPQLGEHTREVLSEAGLSSSEIEEIERAGISGSTKAAGDSPH